MNFNIKNKIKYFIGSFVFLFSLFVFSSVSANNIFLQENLNTDTHWNKPESNWSIATGGIQYNSAFGGYYYSLNQSLPNSSSPYYTFDNPINLNESQDFYIYIYYLGANSANNTNSFGLNLLNSVDGINYSWRASTWTRNSATKSVKVDSTYGLYVTQISFNSLATKESYYKYIKAIGVRNDISSSSTSEFGTIGMAFSQTDYSSQMDSLLSSSQAQDFIEGLTSFYPSSISPLYPSNVTLSSSNLVFTGSYVNNHNYQHLWIKVNDDSPEYCQSISSGSGSYSCSVGSLTSGSYNTYQVYFSNSMVGLDGSPSSDLFSFALSSVADFSFVRIITPLNNYRYLSSTEDTSNTTTQTVIVDIEKSSSSTLDYLYLTTDTYPNGNASYSEPMYSDVYSCGLVSDSGSVTCDINIHDNTVTKIKAVLSDTIWGINDSNKLVSSVVSVVSGDSLVIINPDDDTNLDGVIDENDTLSITCDITHIRGCFMLLSDKITSFINYFGKPFVYIGNLFRDLFTDDTDYSPLGSLFDFDLSEKPLFQFYYLFKDKFSNWDDITTANVEWGVNIGSRKLVLLGPDMFHGYESHISLLKGFLSSFFWLLLGFAIYGRVNKFFHNN